MIKFVLEKHDFNVVSAKNGYEAFQAVQDSFKSGKFFDLVILDLNMPITNGHEACQQIISLYSDLKNMNLESE